MEEAVNCVVLLVATSFMPHIAGNLDETQPVDILATPPLEMTRIRNALHVTPFVRHCLQFVPQTNNKNMQYFFSTQNI